MELTKEQQLIILGLITSIIVGLGVTAYRHLFSKPEGKIIIEAPPVQKQQILVHLGGAVKKEGVYRLKTGDRLIDLLELAGGARLDADLSAVNLAEEVKNGQKIIVPARPAGPTGRAGRAGLININNADEKTLDTLPGVGPATAKAIVEYRRKIGVFSKIEQLLEVPGIGKSKFEKIKSRIMV